MRAVLIWAVLLAGLAVTLGASLSSPLLAWREPVYIAAGFAGVVGLCLMLVLPLLAGGLLPGLQAPRGRRVHRWVGLALLVAVIVHVGGLWITSPPDVVDALLFTSPALFSAWGVFAMWAVFASAMLAALRKPLHLGPRLWRRAHTGLAVVIVVGTVAHAIPIEGTMETVSKVLLCACVVLATLRVILALRVWARRTA